MIVGEWVAMTYWCWGYCLRTSINFRAAPGCRKLCGSSMRMTCGVCDVRTTYKIAQHLPDASTTFVKLECEVPSSFGGRSTHPNENRLLIFFGHNAHVCHLRQYFVHSLVVTAERYGVPLENAQDLRAGLKLARRGLDYFRSDKCPC